MQEKYLGLAKVLVMVFMVLAPVGAWHLYQDQRRHALTQRALRSGFADARKDLGAEVVRRFFANYGVAASRVFVSRSSSGDMQGLPDVPSFQDFTAWVQQAPETELEPGMPSRFENLLDSDRRFFSGLPQKYAGLVELLCLGVQADTQRMYHVFQSFWRGENLTQDQFGFLLRRLPPIWQARFETQGIFFNILPPPNRQAFVRLSQVDGSLSLVTLDDSAQQALETELQALGLGVRLSLSDTWVEYGSARSNLQLQLASEEPSLGTRFQLPVLLIFIELAFGAILYALTRYQRLGEIRRQLLGAASHELRTPLAVMRQFSEMLLLKAAELGPRREKYVQHIHRSAITMTHLVENLLETAKVEHLGTKAHPQPLEVCQFLEDIADSLQQIWGDSCLKLSCEAGTVCWDERLMRQALVNLLQNAHRHGQTDIQLTLQFEADQVVIRVRDFGPGMPPDLLKGAKPFRPGRGNKTGLGLGLYLVRNAVVAHQGQVTWSNCKPGLEVCIQLPKHLTEGADHEDCRT